MRKKHVHPLKLLLAAIVVLLLASGIVFWRCLNYRLVQPSGRREVGQRYAFIAKEDGLSSNPRDQQNFSALSYVMMG